MDAQEVQMKVINYSKENNQLHALIEGYHLSDQSKAEDKRAMVVRMQNFLKKHQKTFLESGDLTFTPSILRESGDYVSVYFKQQYKHLDVIGYGITLVANKKTNTLEAITYKLTDKLDETFKFVNERKEAEESFKKATKFDPTKQKITILEPVIVRISSNKFTMGLPALIDDGLKQTYYIFDMKRRKMIASQPDYLFSQRMTVTGTARDKGVLSTQFFTGLGVYHESGRRNDWTDPNASFLALKDFKVRMHAHNFEILEKDDENKDVVKFSDVVTLEELEYGVDSVDITKLGISAADAEVFLAAQRSYKVLDYIGLKRDPDDAKQKFYTESDLAKSFGDCTALYEKASGDIHMSLSSKCKNITHDVAHELTHSLLHPTIERNLSTFEKMFAELIPEFVAHLVTGKSEEVISPQKYTGSIEKKQEILLSALSHIFYEMGPRINKAIISAALLYPPNIEAFISYLSFFTTEQEYKDILAILSIYDLGPGLIPYVVE